VQDTKWWREYTELAVLFFLHAMAMGMWFVPLGSVLDAAGYGDVHILGLAVSVKALAYGASGISAFISPLIFGALADQRVAPVRLLRVLALATGLAMTMASTAIKLHWSPFAVLVLIQLHALFSTPTWSISTTIVFSRLADARREFGPLRAMATVGWIIGCLIISALGADRTPLAGYSGALVWLGVFLFSFTLPTVAPASSPERLNWKQRLGLDALSLLKHRDNRVVFIAAALYNIPLCAFYPYSPKHLQTLGLDHTTAWMTLGQVTEVITMFSLAGVLTRWRLKPVFLIAMGFGVLRYGLCAFDGKGWLLAGITMHGFAFALFFITVQIYLEQRIETAWRARAQALFTLMYAGFGNTLGYLACGWWFAASTSGKVTHWPQFWGGLATSVAIVFIVFAFAYKGRGSVEKVTQG
jgi:nucleoside transporter